MALETATYIGQLVATNPPGTDDRSTADDHLRLIKAVLQGQFTSLGNAAVTATAAEINLLAGYVGSAVPDYDVVGDWNKQQNFGQSTLIDAANIAWDLDNNQSAVVTLGGNRTLDNPTNIVNGGAYTLVIVQDATGSRTLSYGTAYKFSGGSAPVLSTGANAIDVLSCVGHGGNLLCTIAQDFS